MSEQDLLLQIVRDIGGLEAEKIVKVLLEQSEATEEEIANKMELKPNLVRKILYMLYDNQLVNYRRERDKKTGYHIYYWRLNVGNLRVLLKVRLKKVLSKLQARLRYEKENTFYFCALNGCSRLTMEQAMEYEFRCPKCGAPLVAEDNAPIIKALENRIRVLEGILQQM